MLIFACTVSMDEAMNVAIVYKADDYIFVLSPMHSVESVQGKPL